MLLPLPRLPGSGTILPLSLMASYLTAGRAGAPLAAADTGSPGPSGEAQPGWQHAGALDVRAGADAPEQHGPVTSPAVSSIALLPGPNQGRGAGQAACSLGTQSPCCIV